MENPAHQPNVGRGSIKAILFSGSFAAPAASANLPVMSDIDLAVSRSKRLEQLLEQKLGATGKGLHQKASSVEAKLSPQLLRELRLVATVRNKIVHENDYQKIEDRPGFLRACDDAERQLKAIGGGRRKWKLIALLVALVIVLVLAGVIYMLAVGP